MRGPQIPVLMYHALVQIPELSSAAVHITIAQFEQQMAWLHANGFEAITVSDWHRRRILAHQLPSQAVVLTFDDGYWSLLKWAAPILEKYGFTATLFLTTDWVGKPQFAAPFASAVPSGDRPLTWSEIQVLQALGWDIQAHSCSHRPHAALLPTAQLQAELAVSKQVIEKQLSARVDFYAFPYGSYDQPALQALTMAGYAAGFSVHGGHASAASDPRRLPRLEINASCTPRIFEKLVRTGHASLGAQCRAYLRNALFHFPVVKDVLQKAFARFIN